MQPSGAKLDQLLNEMTSSELVSSAELVRAPVEARYVSSGDAVPRKMSLRRSLRQYARLGAANKRQLKSGNKALKRFNAE